MRVCLTTLWFVCAACALPAGRAGGHADNCVEWQIAVANGSAQDVSVWVSGEGPLRFLGTVGRTTTETWIVASRPDRIEVTDPFRGEARGVEVNARCTSRRP